MSVIYFVQGLEGGPIKIGCTVDLKIRLKALEAHYGQPLALLATMPGGLEEEQAIHAKFAAARLGRTEQFRPVAEIMVFIGKPLLVSADPDVVEAMPKAIRKKALLPAWRANRTAHLHQRVSPEWLDWLREIARVRKRTLIDIIMESCETYANLHRLKPPPGSEEPTP